MIPFGSSDTRFRNQRIDQSLPGPGSYNDGEESVDLTYVKPKNKLQGFGTSERRFVPKDKVGETPGPGSYKTQAQANSGLSSDS